MLQQINHLSLRKVLVSSLLFCNREGEEEDCCCISISTQPTRMGCKSGSSVGTCYVFCLRLLSTFHIESNALSGTVETKFELKFCLRIAGGRLFAAPSEFIKSWGRCCCWLVGLVEHLLNDWSRLDRQTGLKMNLERLLFLFLLDHKGEQNCWNFFLLVLLSFPRILLLLPPPQATDFFSPEKRSQEFKKPPSGLFM